MKEGERRREGERGELQGEGRRLRCLVFLVSCRNRRNNNKTKV